MKRILTMDEKNYPPEMAEIRREAVRGVILIEGRLLMIENAFGEVKLPGGGVDPGEDDLHALQREVREETGCEVIPESVTPFGEIGEKRLSVHEPMIWHHFSRLYLCSVYPGRGKCSYTENEKKYGFRPVLYTVEAALEKNRCMLEKEGRQPWNQREYRTLLLLQEHIKNS